MRGKEYSQVFIIEYGDAFADVDVGIVDIDLDVARGASDASNASEMMYSQ